MISEPHAQASIISRVRWGCEYDIRAAGGPRGPRAAGRPAGAVKAHFHQSGARARSEVNVAPLIARCVPLVWLRSWFARLVRTVSWCQDCGCWCCWLRERRRRADACRGRRRPRLRRRPRPRLRPACPKGTSPSRLAPQSETGQYHYLLTYKTVFYKNCIFDDIALTLATG